MPARLRRRAEGARLAGERDGSAVGGKHAGENLDQRALAGAVGAHQRMDFAGAHAERGRAQGDDRPEILGDVADVEQGRRFAHGWGGAVPLVD
jgi:hypothetical protein